MRRVIAILLENEAGALSRVVGLFAQRAYNIETLTVAPTEDSTLSRVTITTTGDPQQIEQITKHLNRLIEVVKVLDLSEGPHLERELMLVKLRASARDPAARAELKRTVDIFRAQVVDVAPNTYTVQVVGPGGKLDAFLQAVNPGAILEVARTGVSGVGRGDKVFGI